MKSHLNALLYGDFKPTESDRRLYELAKQYHEETEAYDETVCSGRNERGVAMPVDAYEFRLINKNALKIKMRLIHDNPAIEPTDINRAISRYVD